MDTLPCNQEVACRLRPVDNILPRLSIINTSGFHDSDEFVWSEDMESQYRILVLGDSFTFGTDSDLNQGFVDILESQLDDAIVWNTGIPATATNHQLVYLRELAPIMNPDLVVLAFYENDFYGNSLPMDNYTRRYDFRAISQYVVRPDLSVEKLPFEVAWYRAFGALPPRNQLELIIGRTRIGSFVLQALSRNVASDYRYEYPPEWREQYNEYQIVTTQNYLAELQDYTTRNNISLIILDIASLEEVRQGSPTERASWFDNIAQELGFVVLETNNFLEESDYSTRDYQHWNNSGHQKAGMALYNFIEQLRHDE